MLQMFPLLTFSLFVYAVLSFSVGSSQAPWYESETFIIHMMSGDAWRITAGHLFLMFSMMLLFVELLRATRTGTASLLNHALSVLLFIAALMLFLMVQGYGNSIFFIFMAMTMLDFMAGFIITSVASRRDLSLGRVD
jgi:hypothetical protein